MKPLQIGVCTWSLAMKDPAAMLKTVKNDLGLDLVQLGLIHDDWMEDEGESLMAAVKESGIELSATCTGFSGEDYSTIQNIAKTGGCSRIMNTGSGWTRYARPWICRSSWG